MAFVPVDSGGINPEHAPMLTHAGIWQAIDRLAERRRLSLSALASTAGLDPTSLNPSKRVGRDGKPRWPSTETVAKLMQATDTPLAELPALATEQRPMPSRMPCLSLAHLGEAALDEAGRPSGRSWRRSSFPERGDHRAFALEIHDRSMEPWFRKGEVIVVAPVTRIDQGDRLVICLKDQSVLVREVVDRGASALTVRTLNRRAETETIRRRDVRWLYRVRWSQY